MPLCISLTASPFPVSNSYPQTSSSTWRSATALSSSNEDPNYASKLPELLKAGSAADRPDPDVAKQLRQRYSQIAATKTKAAAQVKKVNPELAAELEELADELAETQEKFIALSTTWNAWNRPDPNLAQQLRDSYNARNTQDPNFEANLAKFMAAGRSPERPDPEVPSRLRLLKYKQGAEVKRLAAKEVRRENPALADELEEMADEIEDSHRRFEVMVSDMKTRDANRPKN